MQVFDTIFNMICKIFQNTYIDTPSCIKIRTFWVLEDKYKVQQKQIQNRCLLLLDVKGGSFEHSQSFTNPMAF